MKILVFGKNGQVAWELQRSLAVLGDVRAIGSEEASFLTPESVVKAIQEYKPKYIVNASAYTAVDRAENDEKSAMQVNGHTVGIIASEAKRISASLIHYSTDYVFDGLKSNPYNELDPVKPVNVYGQSKLLGENLIKDVDGDYVILRVSWVYGRRGTNFYRTMLRLANEKESLNIVGDQIGAPTWSRHIADLSAHLLKDKDFAFKKGIYHVSPEGQTSWYEFATKIFELEREIHPEKSLKIQRVSKISTSEYPTPAKRPLNSRMDPSKLRETFGIKLPHWQESLSMVMREQ